MQLAKLTLFFIAFDASRLFFASFQILEILIFCEINCVKSNLISIESSWLLFFYNCQNRETNPEMRRKKYRRGVKDSLLRVKEEKAS